jgi:hypothetical protein
LAVLAAGRGDDDVAGEPSGPTSNPSSGPATASTSVPESTEATTTDVPPNPPTTPRPPLPATSIDCKVADLGGTLGESEGAAGTLYRALVFTNTGRRTCTIQGFPGVSFVAGHDGLEVGDPAVRNGVKGPAVRLRPGSSAAAPLGFTNLGALDPAQCKPTAVRGLRVYPRTTPKAEFVPFATTACAGNPPSPRLTSGGT